MSGLPFAPWHMWGSTQRITTNASSPTNVFIWDNTPKQLARINYMRPDTWSFYFGAEIVDGVPSDVATTVVVQYNLILGVGRSLFNTIGKLRQPLLISLDPGFAEFRWNLTIGQNPTRTWKKWTTVGRTPPLEDGDDTTFERVEWFPAQDIQCQVQTGVFFNGASAIDNSVTIETTALFAPRSHIRPDWFSEGTQFRGNETGGT